MRAGRRTTVMTTGFQGHVGSRVSRIGACEAQGVDLGMRLTRARVKTLAYDAPVVRQDASDARIRVRGIEAAAGQLHSARHMPVIKRVKHGGRYYARRN